MQKSIKKRSVSILAAIASLCMGVVVACSWIGNTKHTQTKANQPSAQTASTALVPDGTSNASLQPTTETPSNQFLTVDSLFSAENGVSVKTNQKTPAYVEAQRNGVLVSSKNAKKVSYEKAINISDNTKDDLLFELQITPNESGDIELNQFLIRFEDWTNPNNYFEISLYKYPDSYGESAAKGIVSVKTNTISQYRATSYKEVATKNSEGLATSYEITKTNTTDAKHGTVVECSFDGRNANAYHTVTNSVKFYYDNEEKAVYAEKVYDWLRYNKGDAKQHDSSIKDRLVDFSLYGQKISNEAGRVKVLDMDLQSDMGSTKSAIWEGFDSEFVRMSVTTKEMNADAANYMILTIDGQTMSGDIVDDTKAPSITVDVDESNLPYGVVGKPFYFSDTVCYDEMYEHSTTVLTKVYFGGEEIHCSPRGFIPERAGTYTLKYCGFDLVGNKAEKVLSVEVLEELKEEDVQLEFDPLGATEGRIDLNENAPVNVDLFSNVLLPEGKAVGASGKTSTQITVKHNNDFVPVKDHGFIPYDEGEYTVTYRVVDSLSNVYLFEYTVQATYSGKAIVQDVCIEPYMLDGGNYKLPKINYALTNAYGEKIQNAKAAIKVYNSETNEVISTFDGNADVLFTANKQAAEYIKVVYEVEYNGLTSTKEATAQILTNECLGDRFVLDEGVTRTIDEYALTYSTTEEGKGFAFVNQVLIEGLNLRFAIPKTQNNFEKLNLYISDFYAKSESIKLTLLKDEDAQAMTTKVLVNGEDFGECKGNFYETASMDFVLSFDGTRVYDSNDDLVGKLTTTLNGKAFDGFSSKFVSIRFEFEGVSDSSAISFTYINNQMMGDFPKTDDYVSPSIVLTEEIGTEYTIGDTLVVPEIFVYDVFDSLPKTTVRLIDGAQNVCFEQEFLFGKTVPIEYLFTSYGEYMLQIKVEDGSGNTYTYMGGISMTVSYNVKPIILIGGEIPTTVSVNKKIKLPEISVYDMKDGSIEYDVYVYEPDGTMTKIDKEFVPKTKGEYSLFVYAVNSSGNVAVSDTFIITVE